MPQPFIFIATNRLKPDAFAAEAARVPELVAFVQEHEPQLLAFNQYVDEARREVAVVQVHPDGASFERHMGVVGERAAQAYAETLEATTEIRMYGTPTDEVLAMLRRQAGAGVPVVAYPHHMGGFTRLAQ